MMHYYNTNMAAFLYLILIALVIAISIHVVFVSVLKIDLVACLERYFEDDEYDGY